MQAQEALDLLLPIPAEDFITSEYTDGVSKCCAVGHIMRLTSGNPTDYSDSNCNDHFQHSIRETTETFNQEKHQVDRDISSVNNGTRVNGYTEPVIKDRVIHLLKDMVEAGY